MFKNFELVYFNFHDMFSSFISFIGILRFSLWMWRSFGVANEFIVNCNNDGVPCASIYCVVVIGVMRRDATQDFFQPNKRLGQYKGDHPVLPIAYRAMLFNVLRGIRQKILFANLWCRPTVGRIHHIFP